MTRRHRRALEFDASVERGRLDGASHLEQRRGSRLTEQPLGSENASRRRRNGRIVLDRAVDRLLKRDALHGDRGLGVNDGRDSVHSDQHA